MAHAVAQALACEDITREVLRHIEGEGTHSVLASVARVNRALSHPALAALWRNLDNILLLFWVLPTFRREMASDTCVFEWDPTQEEWARFMYYACLVQHLDAYKLHHIHHSVWKAVTQFVGDTPLFPQLQRLDRLYIDPYLPTESLAHLLSNTLRLVHLVPGDGMRGDLEEAVVSGLSHVDALNIAHYRFQEDDHFHELAFWTFKNVRDLDVQELVDLTPEKLRVLASLPYLRTLILEVRSFTYDGTKATRYAFKSLETIKLTATLRDMRALISSTSFPHLQRADLNVWRTVLDHAVSAAIRAILGRLTYECSDSLRALSFILSKRPSEHYFEHPSDLHSMSDVVVDELLQCSSLHTLEFSFHVPSALWRNIRLYARDIRQIMSSWPVLRKLVLSVAWNDNEATIVPWFPHADPSPTVHTLAEFAQAHLHLEHLQLPYVCIPPDMTDRDGGEMLRLDSLPVLDHGLKTLHLRTWGVLQPASTGPDNGDFDEHAVSVFEFGQVLGRLFPRLHALQVGSVRFVVAPDDPQ